MSSKSPDMEALAEHVNVQKMEKLVEVQESLTVEEHDKLAPSLSIESLQKEEAYSTTK